MEPNTEGAGPENTEGAGPENTEGAGPVERRETQGGIGVWRKRTNRGGYWVGSVVVPEVLKAQ